VSDATTPRQWLDRLYGSRVLALATIGAFGGAYLASAIKPWGPYCAGALLLAWAALAIANSVRQERLDGISDAVIPAKLNRLERVLRLVLVATSVGLYLYAMLLAHQGRPAELVRGYEQGALAVFWVGNLLIWLCANSARVRADKLKSN